MPAARSVVVVAILAAVVAIKAAAAVPVAVLPTVVVELVACVVVAVVAATVVGLRLSVVVAHVGLVCEQFVRLPRRRSYLLFLSYVAVRMPLYILETRCAYSKLSLCVDAF